MTDVVVVVDVDDDDDDMYWKQSCRWGTLGPFETCGSSNLEEPGCPLIN